MRRMHKLTAVVLVMMLILAALAGCSGNKNAEEPAATGGTGQSESGKSNETKAEEPQKTETIKVSIWERGNAPEGQKITDTIMTRWINEEVAGLGIAVEYVPLPRSEESAKLSAWMASGTAPDVILTYDLNTFLKFASQGGLAPLDESIQKFGQDIMINNKEAMEAVGTYDGKRYAVMAKKPNKAGPAMSIRKDWLDKLGLAVPTTLDELYEVLQVFKEQDPGGVGKDKVIPYSIPALGQGAKGFMFGTTYGAGIDNEGPGTQLYFASGNIVDGQYRSAITTPEGRNHFQFMNKLYKEGLIPKEFLTDVNSQKHTENVLAGYVGFVDSNEIAYNLDLKMKEQIPEVDWVTVEPFIAPDGAQMTSVGAPYGMFIMVPKTSKDKTDAVIKYLNWMSDPDVQVTLNDGFEDEHYTIEQGVRIVTDAEKKEKDIKWYSADLQIMSLGLPWYPSDVALIQYRDKGETFARKVVEYREIMEKYGTYLPTLTNERPFSEKNMSALESMLYEEISKVIIAKDFDAAYDSMLDKWEKIGGPTYDEEVTAGLKEIGRIK
ncbi:extracellular solute-binding protein [Paenibacillus sp. J5C_2022]|uniref:extracellular solute-binding protein n=1 Tax=Paenibacillus sp. J5C2022 TaxID=2977129 RepID=UPI0021D2820E|nr:extracellular solute-binding protein [Paenibacillus sp. J5C2022]MCU6707842.1 extracellular solute-binding protein [Paenibacillus sp. J5C2022]